MVPLPSPTWPDPPPLPRTSSAQAKRSRNQEILLGPLSNGQCFFFVPFCIEELMWNTRPHPTQSGKRTYGAAWQWLGFAPWASIFVLDKPSGELLHYGLPAAQSLTEQKAVDCIPLVH